MGKTVGQVVICKFSEGSFQSGFAVILQIYEASQPASLEQRGQLPPFPLIPAQYDQWRQRYRQLKLQPRIRLPDAQVTHVSSIDSCEQAASQLIESLNQWLRAESFRMIRETILETITARDEAQFLIQTDDPCLQRLPWHLIDFIQRRPKVETAICTSAYVAATEPSKSQRQLRILAILGNSEGIDVQVDRVIFNQVPGAVITFLVEPSRQDLNDQLWKQPWDIFFFAGHSNGENHTGRIYINQTERLTIPELGYALTKAVKDGLRLAIFNSCDGLELARSLATLPIPQMIVMREPVPDPVAQAFLKYLLTAWSAGMPLYQAVRQSREKLQGWESQFPYASWLPLMYQNPVATPLAWPSQGRRRPAKVSLALGGSLVVLAIAGVMLKLTLTPTPGSSERRVPASNLARFSTGERVLITVNATPQKYRGAEAFSQKDYATALGQWQTSLGSNPNDPETRIYLNNAKAIQATDVLKIAVVVPVGGNLDSAEEMLRGVAQAQEEINQSANGINGARLTIQIANDDNQPDVAQQVATALVKDEPTLAVVGHNASAASKPAAVLYQQGGLVMINPTASAPGIVAGDHIFRMTTTSRTHASLTSQYAVHTANISKFAICSDTKSPSSQEWKDEFTQTLLIEGGLVSTIPCDFSTADFKPDEFVSKVNADKVKGLLLLPSSERISEALQTARAGRGLALFGNTILYTPDTLLRGKNDVNGMVLAIAWHPQTTSNQPFLQTATSLWQGSVNWRTAMAYDATKVIIAGLQQSKMATRLALQKAIAHPNFKVEGATGTIQFLPSGERRSVPGLGILVAVQEDTKAPSGYNFFPINRLQTQSNR